jgi:hypothetical protein
MKTVPPESGCGVGAQSSAERGIPALGRQKPEPSQSRCPRHFVGSRIPNDFAFLLTAGLAARLHNQSSIRRPLRSS